MGLLDQMEIINVETAPEIVEQFGVRSVPWMQLDGYIFDEALSSTELDQILASNDETPPEARYISYLLEHGKLSKAIERIEQGLCSLNIVVEMLVDPMVPLNVRIGIGAILEHFEDSDEIRVLIPTLLELLQNSSAVLRTDACHYLSLTHSAEVVGPLRQMLEDEDAEVRQVALESLEVLRGLG